MKHSLVLLLLLVQLAVAACAGGTQSGHWHTHAALIDNYRGPEAAGGGILFVYRSDATIRRVFLAGSFNIWHERDEKYELKQIRAGVWSIIVPLEPGIYQYKFVVDGRWLPDPANPNTRADGFGERFSVVEVR